MSDRRPPMPERVKRAAMWFNMRRSDNCDLTCDETGEVFLLSDILEGRVHFDHSPPLALRSYEVADGKRIYSPDANDPRFIDICSVEGHAIRTNKKRGLYHGDQTQIAKVDRIASGGKKRHGPKIKSRGFATNKDAPFKQTMRGRIVRRDT